MVLDKSLKALASERSGPWTTRELQAQYLDEVLRYVSSFIRPEADAEDVVMEVFQAAFLSLHKLRQKNDPRVWLLGIARRKAADVLRRRYRRTEVSLTEANESAHEPRNEIERRALVHGLLLQLPEDQREALVLKYANGMSTLEVAQVLGRSEAAANSLLQRARDAFHAKGAHLFQNTQEESNV